MTQEDIMKELGEYIEEKMFEKEYYLKQMGVIKRNRSMSRSQLAELCGISKMWMNEIINGNKVASDEILLKIASVLSIDEHELFRVARRIHPDVLRKCKQEYLGEYYIDGI